MQERVILHSDLNNYYASVECMLDPALQDKYVAVCGKREDRHGIVLAKNQKAKLCDVQTGETIWQAQQKCPDLVIVKPHFDLYIKYSRCMHKLYYHYTDKIEPFGLDERGAVTENYAVTQKGAESYALSALFVSVGSWILPMKL